MRLPIRALADAIAAANARRDAAHRIVFCVDGKPDEVVARLRAKHFITTNSPYPVSYARITPALFNTPAELDSVLAEIRALA